MPKKLAKKAKVRVRKVTLAPKSVVRIVAHPEVYPLVLHKEPGTIEVVPVPVTRKPKKIGLLEYLFGYDMK